MINNRQNGRRRGRGGGGNNGQRNGNPGNPNSGNRIDNRARGNANQLYEKYKNLARDAQMSGDRVNTEYYLQFADHYFRVLSESRSRFEEQNPGQQQRRIQPVDSFDDFDDGEDYADEGEPIRAGEQAGFPPRGNDGGRQDGGRQQDPRSYEPRQQEGRPYEGRQQNGRRGDEQPRGGDERREQGGANGHGEAQRDEMPRASYAMTGTPVANDLGEDSPDGAEPTPVTGRRRGRPRREPAIEAAAPAALEADRLPPSLSLAEAPAADEAEEAPRPRRRRRVANGGEAPQAG